MKPSVEPDAVRAWRARARLTQADVARQLGVTRGHYALWEQGRSRLNKTALQKLQQMSGAVANNQRSPALNGSTEEHKAAIAIVAASLPDFADVDPADYLQRLSETLRALRRPDRSSRQ